MKFFIPELRLGDELPAQEQFQEKLGGIPWGLSDEHWPKCSQCQQSQTLLGQFIHHSQRLDLGKEGRVLNVFMCNNDPGACASWEAKKLVLMLALFWNQKN